MAAFSLLKLTVSAAEEQLAIIVRIRRIGMGLVEDGARCDFGPVTTMYDKWYVTRVCARRLTV
jgi:hypothetical protein